MKRGKGAQEACVKSTRRETDETKEDVEGRGREREEGRNVDGVGSVTAGARLGRAECGPFELLVLRMALN